MSEPKQLRDSTPVIEIVDEIRIDGGLLSFRDAHLNVNVNYDALSPLAAKAMVDSKVAEFAIPAQEKTKQVAEQMRVAQLDGENGKFTYLMTWVFGLISAVCIVHYDVPASVGTHLVELFSGLGATVIVKEITLVWKAKKQETDDK